MSEYGFIVGDSVTHVKEPYGPKAFVTEIDADHDLGGVTTCRVVWNAMTWDEAKNSPREDSDIQWTNKLTVVD
jgi:hypothetical protein